MGTRACLLVAESDSSVFCMEVVKFPVESFPHIVSNALNKRGWQNVLPQDWLKYQIKHPIDDTARPDRGWRFL